MNPDPARLGPEFPVNRTYEGEFMSTVHLMHDKLEQASNPLAPLALIALPSCEDLAEKIKEYTTDAYGPTLSIDCACTKDSLGTLIRIAGNASRVITMGFSVTPTEVTNFGITSKELDIRGSRLQNRKFQEAIDLVKAGKVDLDHKVSHTFHFLDAQKAFDFKETRDPSIRKIVLTFDD